MKTLLFLLLAVSATAQTGLSPKKKLAEIEGTYKIDESGNPYYERIIESDKTKEELHKLGLTYAQSAFIVNESEVRTVTPDEILCVGVHHELTVGVIGINAHDVDLFYTLRIQFKENKARLLLTFTDYRLNNLRVAEDVQIVKVASKAPISDYPYSKVMYTEAFLEGHKRAIKMLDAAEASLRSAKSDW